MTMRKSFTSAIATLALSIGAVSASNASVISGGSGGFNFEASSLITGGADGGAGFNLGGGNISAGNPLYHPSFPEHSGVVGLIIFNEDDVAVSVCSGTLLPDRRSILTAGHCVSDGFGTPTVPRVRAYFQPEGGLEPDQSIYFFQNGGVIPDGVTEIASEEIFVNRNYTGEVIDQNDIAIVRLGDEAPEFATSYDIYTEGDLTGQEFNVAGYGTLGDGEGTIGGLGFLRQGNNTYDYRLGDEIFGGFFDGGPDGFFGTADTEFSYISDFDSGLAENDASGLIAQAFGFDQFNDTGLGESEVNIAGGDSGGPQFINGLISGVNSYGLSFGEAFGDATEGLNSSIGEFSGFVPTFIHAEFIESKLVSAPGALALLGLGAFGLGVSARRRKAA